MIDATIHYQRAGSKRQRPAALPMANDYLAYQGQLMNEVKILKRYPITDLTDGAVEQAP
jgi:hypothetical protein